MILMPKRGRLVKKSGNKAQWIAQANVAVIPIASQLIFKRIVNYKAQRYSNATLLQNLSINFNIELPLLQYIIT